MRQYTNATVRSAALIAAIAVGGCSQLGDVISGAPAPEPVAEAAPTADGNAPAAEATPPSNPYLSHTVSVPRAAQTIFEQALQAMRRDKLQKAEVLLQELTVEYPAFSGPWLNLGIVYRDTDRPEQAEEAFQKAIAANAFNLDAYNQLAVLKRERGDFPGAEALYLKALDIWPRHIDSHRNLGILYDLYLGRFDKALFHFETCQRLLDEPDKQLQGWIIELKRRLQNVAKRG